MKNHIFTIALIITLSSFTVPQESIAVYLIGDSTMSVKDPLAYPETGWGMPFANFFDARVRIDNRAKNGRSTRTFISENLWEQVKSSLESGDYVLIQFGHNDEVKEKTDRYTTPEQYATNLRMFIKDTREKGATPILLTPVSRRKFVDGQAVETHQIYSDIVREIAKSEKVLLIDMDEKSKVLLQRFGEESSKLLFLQLEPGEHPNYPAGKIDNTHFNELGARKMAQIVFAELKIQKVPLADYAVKGR